MSLPLRVNKFQCIHLLQQDNPHGGLGGKEDGIYHHDGADGHARIQSAQAHNPPTEGTRR